MNVQQVWQSQPAEAPRISLAYVRHRVRTLERRSRWWNGAEYAGALFGAVFLGWHAWVQFLDKPIALAGFAWFALSFLFFVWHWHRMASVQAAPTDAGVLDTLRFQRRQLERQRDARRRYWRYWVPALIPGIALMIAHLLIEVRPVPWTSVWGMIVSSSLISAAGAAFYEHKARQLQREIDALDTLAASN
jgi:hypothetical protein